MYMKYPFGLGKKISVMLYMCILLKQVISLIQLSEVDCVKELCKMREGVLFGNLSKRDIQIIIDIICIN